jgi:hypothetical protein
VEDERKTTEVRRRRGREEEAEERSGEGEGQVKVRSGRRRGEVTIGFRDTVSRVLS